MMVSKSVPIGTLGFPRIGPRRELKTALEDFWSGKSDAKTLLSEAAKLRAGRWALQQKLGVTHIPSNDFSLYDHVLDTSAMLGVIPEIYGWNGGEISLGTYFAMARGTHDMAQDDGCAAHGSREHSVPALEMTKWFDTNYHYLVPEWTPDLAFDGGVEWLFDEIVEARAQGHRVKVVLLGPLSLLYLGKIKSGLAHKLDLLPRVLAGYQRALMRLQAAGVEWVQIDEPILALELEDVWRDAFAPAYAALAPFAPSLLLTTYFDEVSAHAALLRDLPVAGVHLDLVRGAGQLDAFLADWPQDRVLSIGIIDGRNIWRANLDDALQTLAPLHARFGDLLWIGPSCSLLHVPLDLAHETKLDDELKSWLSFATQKLDEIAILKRALNGDIDAVRPQLAAARAALETRRTSPRIHNGFVQTRLTQVSEAHTRRATNFDSRIGKQQAKWKLPAFPTTTIGSFPQTVEIRQSRAAYKRGEIGHLDYLERMRAEVKVEALK